MLGRITAMRFGLGPPEDLRTVEQLEEYMENFVAHADKLDTPIRGGPRRHHYIPQFYLKRFAHSGKRLVRMPLPVGQNPSRKPTNVTKLAVMRDFYTVLTERGESALVENLLATWDYDASVCFEKLLDRDAWPVSENVKMRMCFWFALLAVRSPYFRREVEAMTETVAGFVNETGGRDADKIDFDGIWGHQTDLISMMLKLAGELTSDYLRRRWQVLYLNCRDGLLLSDTGSSLIPGPSSFATGTGTTNAAEIVIPLSRHHLLCLHSFDDVDERLVEVPAEASAYLVRHYNSILIMAAHQELFCHQNDWDHVLPLAKQCVDGPLLHVEGSVGRNLDVDGVNAVPSRRTPRRYHQFRS